MAAFLPWYASDAVELRGWDLGWTAVVAILLALYAAGRVVWFKDKPQKPEVPVTPPAETFAAAFVALGLTVYRVLDMPTVPGAPVRRTTWLVVASVATVLQTVFAARQLARVGLRP